MNLYILLFPCRESASCTHVSALLHAQVAITQDTFQVENLQIEENDQPLPITSYACKWIVPHKRKESKSKMSEVRFLKHVYGWTRKHDLQPIVNFDPQPPEFHGTIWTHLAGHLQKVKV